MSGLMEYTVDQVFRENVLLRPDHEFVVYPHRGVRWTFSQFDEVCAQMAKGLMAMDVKKGDHVAMWATNIPEWLMTMFATSMIGAVLVTVNTNYKIYELEYLMEQSDSSTLILAHGYKAGNREYLECVQELCPELKDCAPGQLVSKRLPRLKNVVHVGEESIPGMFGFAQLKELGKSVSDEALCHERETQSCFDVINMQYTSGTTGFPKGVMLSSHSIVNNGKGIGDCMSLKPEDRLCIPVPLFHCFGCVLGVMASVTHGTTMVMVEAFNPVTVMEAVMWEKCTAVHGVPTMFVAILEHERFKEFSFPALRTGIMAGSPCPIKVMQQVIDEMGASEITITYGQTESAPALTMTTTTDPIELRVTTVGMTMPDMEVRIADPESGKMLPHGTQGEIIARGYMVMKGYYKMPEATRLAIDEEGWLHTGDLGVMDENGYFKITGRLKDMIIRGGENIYPRELEEFLYTHPAVRDVQVVGVPDAKYGEEVMACIVLREGVECTEEEILTYTRERLSRFKVPHYVWFMESFPMTASGKIQKYKLREAAVEKYSLESVAAIETA